MASDVSALTRQRLAEWAVTFLDRFRKGIALRGEHENPHGFNVAVEVFERWRGQSFYIGTIYHVPRATRPEDENFEAMSARLKHVGGQRFDLAYMRHTGRWHTVLYSAPLAECIEAAETMEIFWPVA